MFTKRSMVATTGLCLVYSALALAAPVQAGPKLPKNQDQKHHKSVATATLAAPQHQLDHSKKKKDEKKSSASAYAAPKHNKKDEKKSSASAFAAPKHNKKDDKKQTPPSQR